MSVLLILTIQKKKKLDIWKHKQTEGQKTLINILLECCLYYKEDRNRYVVCEWVGSWFVYIEFSLFSPFCFTELAQLN